MYQILVDVLWMFLYSTAEADSLWRWVFVDPEPPNATAVNCDERAAKIGASADLAIPLAAESRVKRLVPALMHQNDGAKNIAIANLR